MHHIRIFFLKFLEKLNLYHKTCNEDSEENLIEEKCLIDDFLFNSEGEDS